MLMLPALLMQAQNGAKSYTLHIRVQYADSTGNCKCLAASGVLDDAYTEGCNPLSSVLIAVYHDTDLTATYYTDETGFSPHFKLKATNYRLLFYQAGFDSLSIIINFNAEDIRRRILIPDGSQVSYSSGGNSYFLCVILNPARKNHGVRIVPEKGLKSKH